MNDFPERLVKTLFPGNESCAAEGISLMDAEERRHVMSVIISERSETEVPLLSTFATESPRAAGEKRALELRCGSLWWKLPLLFLFLAVIVRGTWGPSSVRTIRTAPELDMTLERIDTETLGMSDAQLAVYARNLVGRRVFRSGWVQSVGCGLLEGCSADIAVQPPDHGDDIPRVTLALSFGDAFSIQTGRQILFKGIVRSVRRNAGGLRIELYPATTVISTDEG